jgi:hypothetical protein
MPPRSKSHTQRLRDRHEAAQEGFRVQDLITDAFVRRCTNFSDVSDLLSSAGIDTLDELSGPQFTSFIDEHFKCSDWKGLIKQAIIQQD